MVKRVMDLLVINFAFCDSFWGFGWGKWNWFDVMG